MKKVRFNLIINLLVIISITGIIFSSTIYSIVNNNKHYSINYSILEILITFVIYFFIKEKLKSKKILNTLQLIKILVLFVVIRIIWIAYFKTQPIEDFQVLYDTALSYLNGDKNIYNELLYFYNYPYQVFFSVYEVMILNLKQDMIIVQIFNIIFLMGCLVILLKILKSLYGDRNWNLIIFFFFIYGPFYWYPTILTNQIVSIFFILLSLYFFINKKYILSGILLGIGQLLRPIAVVVLLAYILELVMYILEEKEIKEKFINMLKIGVAYKMVILLISFIILKTGIYIYPLNEQPNKMHKFIVGTNQYYGILHKEDSKHIEKILNKYNVIYKEGKITPEQREKNKKIYFEINEEGKKIVLERMKNIKIIKNMIEKFFIFWGGYDLGINYGLTGIVAKEEYMKIFRIIEKVGYTFLLILTLKSLVENIQLKKDRVVKLILLGYIGIYLLIEIQTRYRFELIFFMIIMIGNVNFSSNLESLKKWIRLKT